MSIGESETPQEGRVLRGAAERLEPLYAPRFLVPADQARAWAEADTLDAEMQRRQASAEAGIAEARAAAQELKRARLRRLRALTVAWNSREREAWAGTASRAISYLRRLHGDLAQQLVAQASAGLEVSAVETLAVALAQRLVELEFSERQRAVIGLAERVLAEAGRYRRLCLRVHPQDLPLVEAALGDLQERFVQGRELSVEADPQIERPGIRLETEGGEYSLNVLERFTALLADLSGEGAT